MSARNEAISDTAPSPWWPCPECGNAEFTTTVMFERGQWLEYADEWEPFNPPDGLPTGIGASDVTCTGCGWRGNLFERYGWAHTS